MDTPTSQTREQTRRPSMEVSQASWLFDELSDYYASDNGLSLATSVAVNKEICGIVAGSSRPTSRSANSSAVPSTVLLQDILKRSVQPLQH